MRNHFAKILLLVVVVAISMPQTFGQASAGLYEQFRNPDAKYRPFVRWWWNGDKVEPQELVRELRLLKEAGIGGVEINPIEFPSRCDDMGKRSLVWLSDEWISALKTTFDEAERLGMQCDLIVGSGWPFGSETLPRDERASVMLTYAMEIDGGQTITFSVSDICKAVDPGVTVPNPDRTSELVAIKLAPDSICSLSQIVDLTDKISGDSISIDIPRGKHFVYALVRYDSFACVINGAPGAAGSIVDHMNTGAVERYLNNMSVTLQTKLGPIKAHLRAYFVDSMELEGCNWTSDFAAEFKSRRGYDLMPWLPFIMFKVGRLGDVVSYNFGAQKSSDFHEKVNRVRYDFELTKAELLHERYTKTYLQWCENQGVKSRAQAYGHGFFPLETSLGYDIPEGESWTTNYLRHKVGEEMGDEDYRRGRAYTMINKYVSSAAHLSGKRVVSAEEMTNTYRVFATSLELLKVGSDMSAFSGITHSVWHGFNYSPPEAGLPGWVQYGSYYNEKNTWWKYFHLLNDYRTRMAYLLQNAEMQTDIAILPANCDLWTEYGVQTEPFPGKLNVPYTSLLWEAIHKNGGGADYVSESIISNATVANGRLCYGKKEYSVLFLAEVSGLSQESADKILEFVKKGGRVFCVGKFPDKSLGLMNYQKRDVKIHSTVEKMKKYSQNFVLLKKPADGKYLEWYFDVMNKYDLPHDITIARPDRFLLQNHYVGDDGSDVFLLANANINESVESDIDFSAVVNGRTAWLYDANDGARYVLPLENGNLHLRFGPSEAWLIVFNNERSEKAWQKKPAEGANALELNNWQLTFVHSSEKWTKDTVLEQLVDLKETPFVNFMGDIIYRTTLELDGEIPNYINLGKVYDICELTVNGVACGVQWYGERIYEIGNLLHGGKNSIEIKVTTLMGNYMQLEMKDNPTVQHFMIKRNVPLVSLGLVGPVKVY